METNQNPSVSDQQPLTQEQMIAAIYEQTRKTMNYMKWQLYITVILIVLPLLAMVVLIPIAMKSLSAVGSVYLNGLQ